MQEVVAIRIRSDAFPVIFQVITGSAHEAALLVWIEKRFP